LIDNKLMTAICQCTHDRGGNSADRDDVARLLGVTFSPKITEMCRPFESQGLLILKGRFIILTPVGLSLCKGRG
jgi:hypothetical protein